MLKAIVLILLFPLLLCVGVYGCVAVHVAAVSSALTTPTTQPAQYRGVR
jgi:hypothetical protein